VSSVEDEALASPSMSLEWSLASGSAPKITGVWALQEFEGLTCKPRISTLDLNDV